MLGDFWRNLRYGARMLMKNPGFTLIAVISLALGIGANTAIFSVVNTALLRPLPVEEPEELIGLYRKVPQDPNYNRFSYPNYVDVRDRNQAFESLANDPIGVRLGGQKRLSDRTYLFANLAYEYRQYGGPYFPPFITEMREDNQYWAVLGLHYLLPKAWQVSPQISYLKNNSNIAINEYDRWMAFVSLRRDW